MTLSVTGDSEFVCQRTTISSTGSSDTGGSDRSNVMLHAHQLRLGMCHILCHTQSDSLNLIQNCKITLPLKLAILDFYTTFKSFSTERSFRIIYITFCPICLAQWLEDELKIVVCSISIKVAAMSR